MDSSAPDKLQDEIEKILLNESYSISNINENVKMMRQLYILVGIFLYGFILVISLIGITNIFNTIFFVCYKNIKLAITTFNTIILIIQRENNVHRC